MVMLVFRNKLLLKIEKPTKKTLKMNENREIPIVDEKKRVIGKVKNIHYSKAYQAFMGDLVFDKGPFYTGYKVEFKFVKRSLQLSRVVNTRMPPSKKYVLKWKR